MALCSCIPVQRKRSDRTQSMADLLLYRMMPNFFPRIFSSGKFSQFSEGITRFHGGFPLNSCSRVLLFSIILSVLSRQVFVRMGLYHGTEPLCDPVVTSSQPANAPQWADPVTFDILIRDLPRAAKLCVAVCTTLARGKRDRGKDSDQKSTPSASPARSASMSRNPRPDHDHVCIESGYANLNQTGYHGRSEIFSAISEQAHALRGLDNW